jgi:hypothetical protein
MVGSAQLRSTDQIIEACDRREVSEIKDFWQHQIHVRFSEHYRAGLLAAGISQGKADEISSVVKAQIEAIVEGLEKAAYNLKELAAEAIDARSRAGREPAIDAHFRV